VTCASSELELTKPVVGMEMELRNREHDQHCQNSLQFYFFDLLRDHKQAASGAAFPEGSNRHHNHLANSPPESSPLMDRDMKSL